MTSERAPDDQRREAERKRREGAGQVNLPFVREDEKTIEMVSTGDRLFVISNHSTFEMLTPDKVDPKIEGTNIPWVVVRHFAEGSRQPIIARTILQATSAKGIVLVEQNRTAEFCKTVMPVTFSLMECHSVFDVAKREIELAIADIQKNYEKLRAGPSAVVIPNVPTFDAAVRNFFGSAKRSISKITEAIIALLDLKGIGHGRRRRGWCRPTPASGTGRIPNAPF
jgi:hypothetical protein